VRITVFAKLSPPSTDLKFKLKFKFASDSLLRPIFGGQLENKGRGDVKSVVEFAKLHCLRAYPIQTHSVFLRILSPENFLLSSSHVALWLSCRAMSKMFETLSAARVEVQLGAFLLKR
jgi:hypothetical protein